jgi:hypothetical protein
LIYAFCCGCVELYFKNQSHENLVSPLRQVPKLVE